MDTILLLNWHKALLVCVLWTLVWAICRPLSDLTGILTMAVFQLGTAVIPLYLMLALAYTIIRTQPRSGYLRLNRYTLLLIPAFFLSIVLHNVVYALFYPYFQPEGGDEGPFFVLALIVIPLYFLVVLLYTAFTLISSKSGGADDGHRPGIESS